MAELYDFQAIVRARGLARARKARRSVYAGMFWVVTQFPHLLAWMLGSGSDGEEPARNIEGTAWCYAAFLACVVLGAVSAALGLENFSGEPLWWIAAFFAAVAYLYGAVFGHEYASKYA